MKTKPTEKSPELEKLLNQITNRTEAILANQCVLPPFGCGGEAAKFVDSASSREYTISGLCQQCQDRVFTNV